MTRSTEGDCDIFLAAYEYDGTGRLARHIDANRNTRRFAYDTRGRLIRETDRNGYAFHFRYDDDDRCIVTHGDDNAFWDCLAL
jgi:YD repeat-containing protein